jgi:hypothetical protein
MTADPRPQPDAAHESDPMQMHFHWRALRRLTREDVGMNEARLSDVDLAKIQGYVIALEDFDLLYQGMVNAAQSLVQHPDDPGHLADLRHAVAEYERSLHD